jgi:hypothetical protein
VGGVVGIKVLDGWVKKSEKRGVQKPGPSLQQTCFKFLVVRGHFVFYLTTAFQCIYFFPHVLCFLGARFDFEFRAQTPALPCLSPPSARVPEHPPPPRHCED